MTGAIRLWKGCEPRVWCRGIGVGMNSAAMLGPVRPGR